MGRDSSPSCVVYMPHMKWFDHIRRKPRSGHNKNPHDPCDIDLFTWKWCATHCALIVCVCISHEVTRWTRAGLQSRHDKPSNDMWDPGLDLSSWKGGAISSPTPCVVCISHMRWFSQNRDGATERKRQKHVITGVTFISNDRCDLDRFELEMDCDTSTRHGLYLYQV